LRLLRPRAATGQGGVEADWPTWEAYQEALRAYPSPMMTEEEHARAVELGFEGAIYGLSHDL
jgi:hypothetical protein